MRYQVVSQLAVLRAKHGRISQVELAQKTGITQKQISALESGNTQGIKFATLVKLCSFFNCTPNDLLSLEPAVKLTAQPSASHYKKAQALIARGLQEVMTDGPRTPEQIWTSYEAVREKIADDYERSLQKKPGKKIDNR